MGEMDMCEMDTGVDPLFPEESGADNSVSGLILSNNLLYNLCFFAWESVYFRKKFLIKDSIYRVENDISLYMAYKVITIVLISDKYHQFRT